MQSDNTEGRLHVRNCEEPVTTNMSETSKEVKRESELIGDDESTTVVTQIV